MGGAFSIGIEDYIKEQGRSVDYNVMINTYQVDKINVDKSSTTFYIDYQNTNDPVLFWFDPNLGHGKLENSNMMIREISGAHYMQTKNDENHRHSISSFLEYVSRLPEGKYEVEKGQIKGAR